MSTLPATPITILGAIDYSDTSDLVIQHAVEMARQKRADEIHFLHVHPAKSWQDVDDDAKRVELEEWLGTHLSEAESSPRAVRIVAHEAGGNAAEVIVEMASDLLASVIVIGTHGRRSVQRMLMGSVADAVVRNAGCPVFVVRPELHHQPVARIEPPCAACVEMRVQSNGEVLWCEDHSAKHGRRHTYYNTRLSSWISQRLTL